MRAPSLVHSLAKLYETWGKRKRTGTYRRVGAVSYSIVLTGGTVQLPPHHRDPFDRMLVAQAGVEELTLVTRDPVFARYGVALIEA